MAAEISLENFRKRTLYRACHRGTKEMDWLLGGYVTALVDGMDAEELSLIDEMMSHADPLIENWIMGRVAVSETQFEGLILKIRSFHKL